MPKATKFTSHDHYFAEASDEARAILLEVQHRVEAAVPTAERCISYNLPAYRAGKVFFYFATFAKHLGVYPPVEADPALIRELAPYRNEKGNLRFPYDEPIPYELIGRVAMALAKEYARSEPRA